MSITHPPPLLSAAALFADVGVYGLVWFADDFIVAARYGKLAATVEVGEPIFDSIPPLTGYDDDIRATKSGKSVFHLPSIAMVTDPARTIRMHLSVLWDDDQQQFLLLLTNVPSASEAELELSTQMRKRLMAEQELAQKSRELEQANRDLEDYAAIISHDLSAPLRAMRYLADDADKHVATGNGSKAHEALEQLRAQSRRMSSMMSALLDYASIGRKSELLEIVDTRALLDEITRSTPHPKDITIETAGSWPKITTMAAPLDLVIRNLIDNAIKHHDREYGRILIACEEQDNTLQIAITDDGPGIDPQHHEAVMLPFRSVSGDSRHPSRGMGLALVKRTLDTVGGTLTLRSDPQKSRGSEFLISWPKPGDMTEHDK